MSLATRLPDLGVVALGGAVGSLARYLLTLAIGSPQQTGGFPVATLCINLCGALLLGLLAEFVTRASDAARSGSGARAASPVRLDRLRTTRLLLGTGLLGGFTTYSLLAADLAEMLLAGRYGAVAGYALLTLVLGGAASWCGVLLGRAAVRAASRRSRDDGAMNGVAAEQGSGR